MNFFFLSVKAVQRELPIIPTNRKGKKVDQLSQESEVILDNTTRPGTLPAKILPNVQT